MLELLGGMEPAVSDSTSRVAPDQAQDNETPGAPLMLAEGVNEVSKKPAGYVRVICALIAADSPPPADVRNTSLALEVTLPAKRSPASMEKLGSSTTSPTLPALIGDDALESGVRKVTLLVTGLAENLAPAIVRVMTALPMPGSPPEKARTRGVVRVREGAKRDAGMCSFGTAESFCHRIFSPKPPVP